MTNRLKVASCIVAGCLFATFLWNCAAPNPGETTADGEGSARITSRSQPMPVPPNVPEGYVATPAGYFHSSCIVELAQGEAVGPDGRLHDAAGSSRDLTPCSHPPVRPFRGAPLDLRDGGAPNSNSSNGGGAGDDAGEDAGQLNGWVVNYSAIVVGGVSQASANWVVPPVPEAHVNQVVYFFNGLEQLQGDNFTIIQPVLGYTDYAGPASMTGLGYPGAAPAGWSIASWNCCLNNNALHSPWVSVSSGDLLEGMMQGTECDAATGVCEQWEIVTADVTTSKSTTLHTVSYAEPESWVFPAVLEAYGIAACDQLPGGNGQLAFAAQKITRIASGGPFVPQVGFHLDVLSTLPACGYGGSSAGTTFSLEY